VALAPSWGHPHTPSLLVVADYTDTNRNFLFNFFNDALPPQMYDLLATSASDSILPKFSTLFFYEIGIIISRSSTN
jgi:hypothetical protein